MDKSEIEYCYKYYIKNGGNGGKYNFSPAVIKSLISQYINNYKVIDEGDVVIYDRAGRFIKRINND